MSKGKRNSSPKHTISVLLLELAAIFAIAMLFVGVVAQFANISPPQSESETLDPTPENPLTPEGDSSITPSQETTSKSENSVETDTDILVETNPSEPSISEKEETLPSTEKEEPSQETEPEKEYVGTIYLTFDDGPSTQTTEKILNILSEKGVKATFFILDYKHGSSKEELILRAFNEGHTIGLHGTSHEYSKIYKSLETLIANFDSLKEKVYKTTGYIPTAIRFPGGSSNTVSKNYCTGIMTEAVSYFNQSDYTYYDWNIDSRDAGGVKSTEELYQNVISGLKKGRNNIVLMHDSSGKNFTIEALSAIIDFGLAEGYEFKAITSDTPQVTHKVAN